MSRMEWSRRAFLRSAGALAPLVALRPGMAGETPHGTTGSARANRVYEARLAAARASRDLPLQPAVPNGDEERYPKLWGSYSKGLPHNAIGEVDRAAYKTYLRAITSEDRQVFEQIPLGGYLKLANPQAAYAIDLTGPDAEKLALRTPPPIASAEMAGEVAELYWHALLRDIPFSDYHSHPLVAQAAADLSSMSDFRGPKAEGKVTPATLFRGMTPGGLRGYYVSQFLLRDIPMSPIRVPQKIRTAVAGKDYMTSAGDWYNVLNGQLAPVNTFEDSPRYIRTGRDLCEYVHRDFIYQAALGACLMLLRMSAPLDGGIPYQYSITQGGFVTYGAADIFHLLATVANLSLKVAWYHKWIVHRRVRPEELGGHLHFTLAGKNDVPFHPDLLGSKVLPLTNARYGTHLLAQSYPEGCPPHPSYPAGHAVFAGACITVLKACFAESWVMPSSVMPTRDGTALVPYKDAELTVGGELDKLAENIAISRDFAGVHWRSDGIEGLALGEAYAIGYLRELKFASSEAFTGFNLTTFAGTRLTI